MFTRHDEPVAMNVDCSVAIFTRDRTSGPVESSLPDRVREGNRIIHGRVDTYW